jgi:hypothetical protein
MQHLLPLHAALSRRGFSLSGIAPQMTSHLEVWKSLLALDIRTELTAYVRLPPQPRPSLLRLLQFKRHLIGGGETLPVRCDQKTQHSLLRCNGFAQLVLAVNEIQPNGTLPDLPFAEESVLRVQRFVPPHPFKFQPFIELERMEVVTPCSS